MPRRVKAISPLLSGSSIWGIAPVAAILWLGPEPLRVSQAASFDCNYARSYFAKAICNDAHLSDLDEVVARAFSVAQGGLSEAGLLTLRTDHQAWVDFAQLVCEMPEPDDVNCCISDVFADRIDLLQQGRMIGPFRFTTFARYHAQRDPDDPEHYRAAHSTASVLQIDDDTPTAVAFNKQMMALAPDWGEDEDHSYAAKADGFSGYSSSHSFGLESANAHRISVQEFSSSYPHDAAHNSYRVTNHHFLIGPDRWLTREDIFVGDQWVATASDFVRDYLGDNGFLPEPVELAKIVSSPERWTLDDGGLTIHFQPYEAGSFADGIVRVEVPWRKLETALTSTAHAIISSATLESMFRF